MDLVTTDRGPADMQALAAMPFVRPGADTFPDDEDVGIFTRLRRRKYLFGLVFTTVLACVGGAFMALPAVYKAEALISVGAPDQVLGSQMPFDAQQMTVGDAADLESQSVVLASPMLLRLLLAEPPVQTALLEECAMSVPPPWKQQLEHWLKSKPRRPCGEQVADTDAMVESLRTRVTVGVSGRSRILSLSFKSPSAQVAQTIANAIAEAYLDTRTQEKLRPRTEAVAWLQEETQRVADRLKHNELEVQSFLHQNGIVKGQLAPIASEQLTGLSQQIAVAVAERATAAGRMQQALLNDGSTTSVLEDRTVNDAKQQLSTINTQIAQFSARYGAAYPPLIDLQQQRRALERAIAQDTNVVTRSATADYQAANGRVIALQKQIDQLKQEVRGNDDAATEIAALERDLVTDRELYVDLTKSLNQLETNRRLVTPNARLVSLAEKPQAVSFPKLSTFAVTGFVLATALASIAALLRDRSDRTVRTIAELQNAAEQRVLACIPHVPGLDQGGSRLTKRIAIPSLFQEAVRGLYAECLLVSSRGDEFDGRRRSILVTSSDRGEGKSFTTLALAHFAAAAGRRVIVLECDLRQPSVARSLSVQTQWGISEILRGQITPDEAVLSTKSPRLDVIISGKPTMSSAELLGGARMAQLLAWATARYDLVLVDSPPVRMLPDARILAPYVDAVLYCARWGQSRTRSVVQGLRALEEGGGKVQGIVLDGVQPSRYRLYDRFGISAGSYLAAS